MVEIKKYPAADQMRSLTSKRYGRKEKNAASRWNNRY